jgi:CO/xanthine dehydrogenase FAD-binding subunit
MKEVGYFAPTDVGDALKLLAQYGESANVLAGGTDLVPKINHYEVWPDNLIYIGGLGMNEIKKEGEKVVVGAGTTWTQIATSPVILENMGVLVGAANAGGSVATRNAGTIGGNVVTASPAADLTIVLMALGAELELKSAESQRMVAIEDFFTGPGETVRKAGELLTEIHIPIPKGKTSFMKLGRRKAMTLSVANTGIQLVLDGQRCVDACVALGAMAPTPLRCSKAEAFIKGKDIDKAVIADCAGEAVAESSPIDDQRATAWYRKKAGKALVARALAQAAGIDF